MNIPLGNSHITKGGTADGKKQDIKEKVVTRGNEPIANKSTRSLAEKMYPNQGGNSANY